MVVMITGFSVEEIVIEALEEGAYALLYKPYEIGQIIDIVNNVLKMTLVFLVDHHAMDRKLLRAILEENGYQVMEASDGPAAIALASAKHYGVILMDINMPDMDGFTALEKIRQIDPQTKAIFITGYTAPHSVIGRIRARTYAALSKPVDPEELLALARSITGSREAV